MSNKCRFKDSLSFFQIDLEKDKFLYDIKSWLVAGGEYYYIDKYLMMLMCSNSLNEDRIVYPIKDKHYLVRFPNGYIKGYHEDLFNELFKLAK